MRVRKAVPEGYKTKSLFETVGTYACGCSSAGTQAQESEYKGLVPYCGISKVGALRLQGAPDEKAGLALDIDDWSCPSSQALGGTDVRPTSVAISRSANYKRRRDGDDQEHEIVELQPVYPRSGHIINHAKASDPNALRVIAISRTRRIREGEAMKRGVDGNVNMTSTEDFEEAEFFRGEEWANLVLEF